MPVTLTIDDQKVQAPEGRMLLQVAREMGITIPTLCEHEALEPWGGCRLCIVEITKPEWDGWSKLVTSCLYPVAEGLIVNTKSDKVQRVRRNIVDLLLARCPHSPQIQELACSLGITHTSFKPAVDRDNCIMCGLCVRICEHIGVSAIGTINRGPHKTIATPYGVPSDVCIGCLACAHICPTGNIPYQQEGLTRTIWNRSFKLVPCEKCGRGYITEEQLAHQTKRSGLDRSYFTTCDACKRQKTAAVFRELASWQKDLEELV